MSTPQLPLGLRFAPDQRLQDYRDAAAGLLPLLQSIAAAGRTAGEGNDALFLTGSSGAGKTHLLLGLCAEAATQEREVAYLPLRMFGERSIEALTGQGAAALVCIDDVEAIAGVREAEIALFDLHNRLRAAGAAIVYAANATPSQLALDLPDLRSRLAQCTQFALNVPDEAARRAILRQRAQTRGLELDDAVLDWLFRRVDRDLGTLTALLDRLDRASLAAQRRITVPFLRQTLGVDQ